jgi:hypothetical protein
MVAAGGDQPLPNELDILLWCRYAPFRLLLKRVKNVDHAGELRRIHRTVRVGVVAVDDLHYPGRFEALQGLRRGVGLTLLRGVERLTNIPTDRFRKAAQVPPARGGQPATLSGFVTVQRVLDFLMKPKYSVMRKNRKWSPARTALSSGV